eukprot:10834055-Alexandrium_andersonii.AAC.1
MGSRETEVLGDGRQAQPLCSSLDDACQLGLAGARSNGLSGRGPTLNGVQPAHAHPPARGPPSPQAPGEVRVDVRAGSGPFVLSREV